MNDFNSSLECKLGANVHSLLRIILIQQLILCTVSLRFDSNNKMTSSINNINIPPITIITYKFTHKTYTIRVPLHTYTHKLGLVNMFHTIYTIDLGRNAHWTYSGRAQVIIAGHILVFISLSNGDRFRHEKLCRILPFFFLLILPGHDYLLLS